MKQIRQMTIKMERRHPPRKEQQKTQMPRLHRTSPLRHFGANELGAKSHFTIHKRDLPRNGNRTKTMELKKRSRVQTQNWNPWLENDEEWRERNKKRVRKEGKNLVKTLTTKMAAHPLPFANSAMTIKRFRFVSSVDVVFVSAKKISKSF